ncbi:MULTISPECIES: carbohydrate ABC transporter permease [Globicatella]|uniref:Lactose ABC transporter membrane protein n=2 Tax=Globicatella sulfidifaciens TaxID=136093 RepID=A0A1T4LJB4_9LACT|nr:MULTISPECIES: sugar ABC transporter permease [Globicatella]MDT2768871.1 sugar ABC transporter permease [Globicatella sulfidifaciens]NLJ18990.1 sugar ABC transporter permease [Globicatella sulfidifaciens]WPC09217.1 sugar ABC transporter permease [Globicatella sp. PHS-GS-PNBC-21-1553]SJZ54658.1 lactose ABC transporter membrane protein [Globicatella sulfidifaciens DSM 15739]
MNVFQRRKLLGWAFIAAPVALIILFYFYPMLSAFIMSLQSGKGANLSFVGLTNYKRLLSDPVFIQSLKNTLIFLIFQVPIMVVLAIFFSVLLNNKTLKFKGIFRTIVFLPSVTSLVAYSLIFKYIFANNGVLNQILMAINVLDKPIMWLSHPFWAKVVIIIAITWRWTGYNMIFFLSALQNIDDQIYEAADVDGASPIDKFFKITLPLLKPVILFTSITSTIGTLQLFDEPMNITQGGPGNATMTISQYIYNLSFKYTPDFGYAAAVSYAIVILVIIFSIIQLKVGNRDEK